MSLGDFMRKTQFCNSALRVAKTTIDVEGDKTMKKDGTHNVASVVFDESFIHFFRVNSLLLEVCLRSDSAAGGN